MNRRRGSTLVEAAMWIPIASILLVGMAETGRFVYTYHALRKALYSVAQYVAAQQGVDFCNTTDAVIAAALSFGVDGSTDATGTVQITGLTADMIQVTPESWDPVTQTFSTWQSTGCDTVAGGSAPQFIVVSMRTGYLMQPRIPFVPQVDPIPLRPVVKVPYGG